ncbi:MAG: SlyX family protein [Planctomycetota bacterium]
MKRARLVVAGVVGATAVALGAYAAHGLQDQLAKLGYDAAEVADRVENFATGARYQLATGVALLALGLARRTSRLLTIAFVLLSGGIVVFSVCLYALAFVGEGWRWLGAVVPLGGLAMIAGWTLIAAAGFTSAEREQNTPPETERLQSELVRLEEVITHQQKLVNDLNEALTDTRRDVDVATPKLRALDQTVKRLAEFQQGAEDDPDERPPHY